MGAQRLRFQFANVNKIIDQWMYIGSGKGHE